MIEKWKDIEHYEGIYQVSNLGRVRSIPRVDGIGHPWHGKVLKPTPQRNGYLNVSLLDGHGNRKKMRVHRLVAQAFVPNPNNYQEVNHLDECRTNNCASNLEWCTTQQNLNYGTRSKKQSQSMKNNPIVIHRLRGYAKSQRKPVLQITLNGLLVKEWPSVSSTSDAGFKISGVSDCCLGKISMHHGYKWKFKEETIL
ncbi:NUMOD4 motif-containing HNH endonuclease [Schleiferilactobacillus harbinensis]|uniref:NUMOD4 motif-containing HNH endonuclease n=1 Tax=Schleiferilactobacillus harbinensis TaxID=304207 RepID=UPI0021A5517B|nr:NUMOD4 motif-containing HNH endonuclease [Schleiferilactobacillus harbinensis]